MSAQSVFRTASFWIFVVFAALVILQQSPMPGVYLMMFGAPLLAGRLAHIFLAAVFVESLLGRLPRALAVVPIAAYGAYYSFYAVEAYQIAAESAQLRRDNPGLTLKFDPATQALVVRDAQIFVSSHDIPVAYKSNANIKPDGYLSYRVLSREHCVQARAAAKASWTSQDARVAINVWGRHIGKVFDPNSCILQLPEKPTLTIVSVAERDDLEIWKQKPGISEQSLDFALDGKPLATYRVASIWRLPAFPTFYIGCALNDAGPAWQCGADFARIFTPINFSSDNLDEALYDGPIGVVLGIKPLAKADLSNVAPNPDFDGLLTKIGSYAQRDESYIAARNQDLFGKFADFLKDHTYKTEQQGA